MSVQNCQACSAKFGLFKKKTRCFYCDQFFCRNCIKSANRRIPNFPSSVQTSLPYKNVNLSMCNKCMIMSAPGVSHLQLMSIDIRFIKLFLTGRGICIDGYAEKGELTQLIVDYNRGLYPWTVPRDLDQRPTFTSSYNNVRPNRSQSVDDLTSPAQQPNETENLSSTSSIGSHGDQNSTNQNNMNEATPSEEPRSTAENSEPTQTINRRASLADLHSIEDIDALPIRDIKVILTKNFVNYKGCVEKNELKERLRALYRSNKELETRQQQINAANENQESAKVENAAGVSANSGSGQQPSGGEGDDLCKICMDRLIDCVLVECGHMCSCVKCGKLLSECPICRQYVVRVIRVFKP